MRDTAIPNEIGRRAVPRANNLTRIFVCLLGAGAIAWGVFILPLAWQESVPRTIAAKLLERESVKRQSLVELAKRADETAQYRFCNPVALHMLFILRLFLMNEAIESRDQPLVSALYDPLYDTGRRVLSCAPADSFVWLTLFWVDAGKHGLNDSNITYLRLSYALSRNEAWIGLWRSRLVFLMFNRLPVDLSSEALDEFAKLVNTGWFYQQTARIFGDASTVARSRIIEQLQAVNLSARRDFARALRDEGIGVSIPGVEALGTRPWR